MSSEFRVRTTAVPLVVLLFPGSFADIEIHSRRVAERVPAVAGLRAQGLDYTEPRGGLLCHLRGPRLGSAGRTRPGTRPVASALLALATELSTGGPHAAGTATEGLREQHPQLVFVGRFAEHPGGVAGCGNPCSGLQRPSLSHVTLW